MERRSKELALCLEPLKKARGGGVERLKIAANLDYMYRKQTRNMLEQYALAKRSGFSHVEGGHPFDYPLAKVKEAKEKAGVEHVLINMYEGKMDEGELGFAAIPGKEKEFCDGFEKLVEYAKALNCRNVHIVCGQVFNPTPENDEVCFKNLTYAVEVLEKEDLIGMIECINWVVEPGYYFDSFKKCVDMIEKINSPHLKLLLDIYHLQYCNGNLTCNLKWLLPYTGHIQISQIPGRHEPGSKGEMDYDFLFQLLRELGYSGWIGLEYLPAGHVDDGLQWFADQNCIGYEPASK